MRKFCIGDIRGELGLLEELLEIIQPTDQDHILFLGSYLGPGPNSKGVIDYLIDLKAERPEGSTKFLWGCFEHMFDAATSENPDDRTKILWANTFQGLKVLESYAKEDNIIKFARPGGGGVTKVELNYKIPMTHIDFMSKNLHLWYQDHDYPFVASHAGLNPHNFNNPTKAEVVFGSCVDGTPWYEMEWRLDGLDIVFSHIPFDFYKPFLKPGKVGIDLGAGYGGNLCAVEYPEKAFHIAGERKRVSVNG